jgi:hypothetical protein
MRTRLSRNLFTQFQYPWLKQFMDSCQLIEQDKNYQPYIKSPDDLLSLVKDENGKPKHSPIKSAMAIMPAPLQFTPLSLDGQSLGVLYQVLVTKGCYLGGWFGQEYDWRIECRHVIVVNKSGVISIHSIDNARNMDFSSPLTDINISNFLNQECLHYQENNRIQVSNFKV